MITDKNCKISKRYKKNPEGQYDLYDYVLRHRCADLRLTVAHGKTIGEVIDNWNLNKVKHIDADSIVLCKGETIEECKARTKEYWGY
jgi:hypothetical protein